LCQNCGSIWIHYDIWNKNQIKAILCELFTYNIQMKTCCIRYHGISPMWPWRHFPCMHHWLYFNRSWLLITSKRWHMPYITRTARFDSLLSWSMSCSEWTSFAEHPEVLKQVICCALIVHYTSTFTLYNGTFCNN
jgi:hypothetical protein